MSAPVPDLAAAASAVALARSVIKTTTGRLAAQDARHAIDANQIVAFDLAHSAAAVEAARAALAYAARGDLEARIGCAFVADALWDVMTKILGREVGWGAAPGALDEALPFVRAYRDPAFLASLAGEEGPRHLDSDFELVQDTFRRFAEERIRPVAEHVHRTNGDIPEDIVAGLAGLGGFGLSVPEEY